MDTHEKLRVSNSCITTKTKQTGQHLIFNKWWRQMLHSRLNPWECESGRSDSGNKAIQGNSWPIRTGKLIWIIHQNEKSKV